MTDTTYKIIKYVFLALSGIVFAGGIIMVVVADAQGKDAPSGLSAGGVFTMIVGIIAIVIWVCRACRWCGTDDCNTTCCCNNEYSEFDTTPSYV